MAQSVEKLPSENTSASLAGSNISSSGNNSISDFLSKIANSFADGESVLELRRECLIAVFGLINLIISKVVISQAYFTPVYPQLNKFCIILFSLLSLPLAYFALQSSFLAALKDLRARELSVNVCKCLAVIVGGAFLLYALAGDFNLLVKTSFERNFILLVAVIAAGNYIEAILYRQIINRTGFEISRLVRFVRRVPAESELLTADSELPTELTDFSKIKLGDIIVVEQGDLIALDGDVIDGTAQAKEVIFNPKGTARLLLKGDRVFSGSQILRGRLVYRVTALNEDAVISDFAASLNNKLLDHSNERIQTYNSNQTLTNLVCIFFAITAGIFWITRFGAVHSAASAAMAILMLGLTSKLMQLNLLLPLISETAAFYKGVFYSKDFLSKKLTELQRLVVDFSLEDRAATVKLSKIEMIDKRVDEKSLPSVLFALAGRGAGPEAIALTNYITEQNSEIELHETVDYNEFYQTAEHSERGFFGKISGVDFTVGNEDFLLERGVLVQVSEVDEAENLSADQYCWYVALQSEVIAYLLFTKDSPEKVTLEFEKLRARGFKATLCSHDQNKEVDAVAQSLGFELADIYGGLNDENYAKKLESLKPLAFFYRSSINPKLKEKAEVTISVFDEVLYDLKKSDILVFDNEFKTIFDAVLVPLRTSNIEKQNLYMASSLSLLLIALSVLNMVSPVACAFAVFAASCGMLLNILRLNRF